MANCETEDTDGQDITYRSTNNLNTYTQGWNYFCLILPAQKWDTTDLTVKESRGQPQNGALQ